MHVFNMKDKNLTWYNRNYYFAGTLFFVLLNILIFKLLGPNWNFELYDTTASWEDFSFINCLTIGFAALSHASWRHVLINMLFFTLIGIYLERKMGTLSYVTLVVTLIFTVPALASHVKGDISHHGFSGVISALVGINLMDCIFSLFRKQKDITNIIFAVVTVVSSLLFCSGIGGKSFSRFNPIYFGHNLIHNMAHYTAFFWGILIYLVYKVISLCNAKQTVTINEMVKEKQEKPKKQVKKVKKVNTKGKNKNNAHM